MAEQEHIDVSQYQQVSAYAQKSQDDKEKLKRMQKLAEDFRYSDPVSNEALKSVENDLEILVSELQNAVSSGDNTQITALCGKISTVLTERNRLCKLNK